MIGKGGNSMLHLPTQTHQLIPIYTCISEKKTAHEMACNSNVTVI